jgi:hypothetical protein
VANTANALVQLLGLVFGVAVGRSVATSWFGIVQQPIPDTSFSGTHVLAAVAAGTAFTVTLRAQSRAAPIMCSATALAIVTYGIGKELLGPAAGVFVAALAIGGLRRPRRSTAAALAARLHRPGRTHARPRECWLR